MCCRTSASARQQIFRCCWQIEGTVPGLAEAAVELEAAAAGEVGSAALESAPEAEPFVVLTAAAVELAGSLPLRAEKRSDQAKPTLGQQPNSPLQD